MTQIFVVSMKPHTADVILRLRQKETSSLGTLGNNKGEHKELDMKLKANNGDAGETLETQMADEQELKEKTGNEVQTMNQHEKKLKQQTINPQP